MSENDHDDVVIEEGIRSLIESYGANPNTFESELVAQIIETGLKLLDTTYDAGQLKVINRSMKEMRYAYQVFNRYKKGHCVSIFGSARTPEDHPDYIAARNFSAAIAKEGWMCITGAANGIMKASMEGPRKEDSFGLSIRLPFESTSNTVIAGDPKLIIFRYFFTRKLMFMSHSSAMVAFPGGYGTQDEVFEMLTLIQTGKTNIIPVVLAQGENSSYWNHWLEYVNKNLLEEHWISANDERLFYIAPTVEDAVNHVLHFYSCYQSSRYVKDVLVIRLTHSLTKEQIDVLNDRYPMLIASGVITATDPLPEETDQLELPRLAFHHTRKDFALLRMLIDDINNF